MKNKKEIIKEAWKGFDTKYSLHNGWAVSYATNGIEDFPEEMLQENFDFKFVDSDIVRFRPKSLQGIEDNNGWIKINSNGSNLPKIDFHTQYWFYNGESIWIETMSLSMKLGKDPITHYQTIQRPNPPIY